MQNNDKNQRNRNESEKRQDRNQRNRNDQFEKKDNDLFQFEMGNELGANIEQEKSMFKNEYEKDKLKNKNRQNNNFSTNKNQFK